MGRPPEEARQRLKIATAMLADLSDSPLADQYRADAIAAFDDAMLEVGDDLRTLVDSWLAQGRVIEAAREVSARRKKWAPLPGALPFALATSIDKLDSALAAGGETETP